MPNTYEGSRNTMLVLLKSTLLTLGIGLTSLFGLLNTSNVAWTAAQTDSPGLAGILAPEPPTGLWEDDFLTTGETWEEWALAAAEDVMNLYAIEDDTPLEEQKELLAAVADRLDTIEIALADDAYAKIHEPLAVLYGKLKPRYDLAQAIFDTLNTNPAQAKLEQLAADREKIAAELTDATDYLNSLRGGEDWLAYLELSDAADALSAAKGPKDVLQAVTPVVRKVNQRNKLEDQVQQEFLGRKPFLAIVDAVKAYRQTTNMKVEKKDMTGLRAALTKLVSSIESYNESKASADAKAVHKALADVKSQAPDGGAQVEDAVRAHYLNYNLHIVASEAFLDKVVRDKHNESSKVRDYVLGANVSGTQKTETTVGLDVKPSDDGILFDLVLNGVTRSNTAGVTSQATVYTAGRYNFTGRKEIKFDGDTFDVAPARVSVSARNNTYAASTRLDGVPIFSGIARGIAKSEAAKRRPQSEAIARSKVRKRVEPEFNKEANEQFEQVEKDLQNDFYKNLREAGLFPSARNFKSSDTHILMDTRTMAPNELGGSRPVKVPYDGPGASVDLHESAVNNTFSQMKLAGKTMTEKEFGDYLRNFFNKAFGLNLKPEEKTDSYDDSGDDSTAFVFTKEDPLLIRFSENEVELTISAGLKQQRDDDIPPQRISVPLTFVVEGDKVIMEAGKVGVSPVEKPESLQLQIARAGIMRGKIGNAIKRQELDANVEIADKNDDPNDDKVITIKEVSFLNGWARIIVE
ncbi:MAG: hypothetical protein HUJ26_07090 [Planctomycetaceae bacterium]|nr:hypothetical protein [Planctomycetaceae bacterium]